MWLSGIIGEEQDDKLKNSSGVTSPHREKRWFYKTEDPGETQKGTDLSPRKENREQLTKYKWNWNTKASQQAAT